MTDELAPKLRDFEAKLRRMKPLAVSPSWNRAEEKPDEAVVLHPVSHEGNRVILDRNAFDELVRLAAECPSTVVKPKESPTPTRKKEPSPLAVKLYNSLQFVGFFVFAVAVVYVNWPQSQSPLLFDIPEKPTTPAVVTDLADVQWKGAAPKLGGPLQPGQLVFESGTVELLFFNGVRSVIEGPADLVLMNEGQVFCRQGNWSVTVPSSGVGFEIQTPHSTIRDLGTRFYAAVDNEKCDLHVLKGAVELKGGNGKATVYKTSESVSVQAGKIFDRMPNVADLFVPKTEMRRRSSDYWQRNPPPPLPSPRGGGEGGGPILSVDFSQENPEGITLVSGSQDWQPEKGGAFRFTDAKSRIRLKSRDKLSSLTVLLNVKIDSLSLGFNPILMSEGTKPGGLVWTIKAQGSMVFGLRGQASRGAGMFETPIVFTEELLGEWVQFGLCVDGNRGRMIVYVNGDPVCSGKLPNGGLVDLSKLDIGNWKLNTNIGQLDGAVKSMTVFDRALELHEIRLMTND